MSDDDNFFGAAPSLSWSRKTAAGGYEDIPEMQGRIRGGLVTAVIGQRQATDMGTGKPSWWEPPTATTPGRPKLQYLVTLRCDGSRGGALDERNHAMGNDSGDRTAYISDGDQRKAVGAAFRANGASGIKVGDELYLAWTGYRPSKIGGKPAKTWAAKHVVGTPPAPQWGEDPAGGAAAGPAAPAGGADPFGAAQPAAAPQGPQVTYGNGPAAGQPVPVAQGPGAAPQPASPFGGPLPEPAPPQQARSPFA